MDGVEVTGTGAASAPPDVVRLDLAAEVTAGSVAAALDAAGAALSAMRAAVLAAGVAPADLTTSELSVTPGYAERGRPDGYSALLGLSVRCRDVPSAGALLGAAVDAGGDAGRVHGLSFAHSDPAALARSARDAAWADALSRGEQLAALAGRRLGRVAFVGETAGAGDGRRGEFAAVSRASAAVPVEPGTSSVRVRLQVRWELD